MWRVWVPGWACSGWWGLQYGGEVLGVVSRMGVVVCALCMVRVNDVAHLGRKNLVSSSCGLGCCGWGEGFAVFFVRVGYPRRVVR